MEAFVLLVGLLGAPGGIETLQIEGRQGGELELDAKAVESITSADPAIKSLSDWKIVIRGPAIAPGAASIKPSLGDPTPTGSLSERIKLDGAPPGSHICAHVDRQVRRIVIDVIPKDSSFLCVEHVAKKVVVTPERPPPGRTRVGFDATDGEHVELTWHPYETARLSRSALLKPGTWQVSFWADPIRASTRPEVNFAWQPPAVNAGTDLSKGGAVTLRDGNVKSEAGKDPPTVQVRFRIDERPALAEAIEALGQGAEEPIAAAGARAFGETVDPIVEELLRVVADVAVERAQSKALALFEDRVVDALCRELRVPPESAEQNSAQPGSVHASADAGSADAGSADAGSTNPTERALLLPRTCRLISNLRLSDVASSGEAIANTLRQDLTAFGLERAAQRIERANLSSVKPGGLAKHLRAQVSVIVDDLMGTSVVAGELPQRLLVDFARALESFRGSPDAKEPDRIQDLLLAFAIIARCSTDTECDVHDVADFLRTPAVYFQGAPPGRPDWADIGVFISRGVEVMRPAANATQAARVRLAVALLFDAYAYLLASDEDGARQIARAGRLFDAALARELQQALLVTVEIFESELGTLTERNDGELRSLKKATALLGALSSYLRTYAHVGGLDASQQAEQHEARKKALLSLIDATTDRRNRAGEGIFSLGVNVGALLVSGERLQSTRWRNTYWTGRSFPQLSLPLGVAYDYTWRIDEPGPFCPLRDDEGRRQHPVCEFFFGGGMGFHLGAYALDVGQYASVNNNLALATPRLDTAIAVGGQVALLLFGLDNPVTLGLDVRYSPTLRAKTSDPFTVPDDAGVTAIGLFVGYYVPLFDFN